MTRTITVAHSPDLDDVFMFRALTERLVETPGRRYELIADDIETLNRETLAGVYDVSAISFGAYPLVRDTYDILAHGSSIGLGYGPVVVARERLQPAALAGRRVAIPGRLTTAYLAARLALPEFEAVEMPFKTIGPAVRGGEVEAGILIHEGQLTWRAAGLEKILDLGEWWRGETGQALALGANAIRRSLGPDLSRLIAGDIRKSIEHGLEHRSEALAWSLARTTGLDVPGGERYLDMYVNAETTVLSEGVREALRELYRRAGRRGLLAGACDVRFVDA